MKQNQSKADNDPAMSARDRAIAIEMRAIEVFGSKYDALLWMAEPSPMFDMLSPRKTITTELGRRLVEQALEELASRSRRRKTDRLKICSSPRRSTRRVGKTSRV